MEWVWIAAIGFVVGLIFKLWRREYDPGGFFMPMLIGMGGAGLAAFLGQGLGFFNTGTAPGYIGAAAGAIVFVLVLRTTRG
jgi:uncharacterized membrane protein YeaQ/YmgE (transglycosylase-associated protein family)